VRIIFAFAALILRVMSRTEISIRVSDAVRVRERGITVASLRVWRDGSAACHGCAARAATVIAGAMGRCEGRGGQHDEHAVPLRLQCPAHQSRALLCQRQLLRG